MRKKGKKGNLRSRKSLDGCRGLASLPEIKNPNKINSPQTFRISAPNQPNFTPK